MSDITHAKAYAGDIVYVTTENITADKCKVIQSFLQFPRKIVVESMESGRKYCVYPEWHCYNTEEDAKQSAEKYKNGHVDIIY